MGEGDDWRKGAFFRVLGTHPMYFLPYLETGMFSIMERQVPNSVYIALKLHGYTCKPKGSVLKLETNN